MLWSSRTSMPLFVVLMAFFVPMAAVSGDQDPTFVSVCGDPAMSQPEPRVLLEGWNFCNRCGRACTVAPRWADCVGPDGKQRVTADANNAGLPAVAQNQSACDAFTEAKERSLGGLCARPGGPGNTTQSYFWTAMLKSGAMNNTERGRLCGLWCAGKEPNCNVAATSGQSRNDEPYSAFSATASNSDPWTDDNYIMRQPVVGHQWSTPDGAGGYRGSFYGTWNDTADIKTVPTPDTVIAQALSPGRRWVRNISGIWLGNNGDDKYPILVEQAAVSDRVNATCEWAAGPGRPAPWNRTGTASAQDGIIIGPDRGTLQGNGSIICWSKTSWWCRRPSCPVNATVICTSAPPVPAVGPIQSYFGLEWTQRDGRRVFRNVLRSGNDMTWLMLYTGPEAATGEKGGYPWDGRGIITHVPTSTSINASDWPASAGKRPKNNFQVRVWTNITLWPGGPGFYFLNMGACWKDDGADCDYDITTDVTRYLLFQLPSPKASLDDDDRCGPRPVQLPLCPKQHVYRNGSVVSRTDPRFPFRAYHSVSRRTPRVAEKDGGFKCKHDCWSNPQDQDWVRLEPSPEWAEYGFPESVEQAMSPNKWTMDVGAVTALTATQFSGKQPAVMHWHTLNVGPELSAKPGATAVWELAEYDVLVDSEDL